jgi:hypothetical protein
MTAPSLLDPAHMLGQALSDGAGYGVASPDRVSQRKGYRHRELDTGSARSTWRSRSCARAAPTTPGQLGGVRDRQVLRRRLDAMFAQLDDTLLLGPVKARIDTVLQGELIGERYLALPADIAN